MTERTDRDYASEFHALARVFLTGQEQPNSITAKEMVSALREQDIDLLAGWLMHTAEATVKNYLDGVDRVDRARARMGAKGKAFANAVLRFEAGDEDALSVFAGVYNVRGRRLRIGSMTADDHRFVADRYHRSAAHLKFLESVHRAIASRLNGRTTEEVFSEEQYTQMFTNVG